MYSVTGSLKMQSIDAATQHFSRYSMQPTLWQQIYDPFGSMTISTLMGAVPVVVMLVGDGFLHMKAHVAAGELSAPGPVLAATEGQIEPT